MNMCVRASMYILACICVYIWEVFDDGDATAREFVLSHVVQWHFGKGLCINICSYVCVYVYIYICIYIWEVIDGGQAIGRDCSAEFAVLHGAKRHLGTGLYLYIYIYTYTYFYICIHVYIDI